MNSKAQTVSTDALIAVALFLIIITFFFSLTNDQASKIQVKNLQEESAKLTAVLSSGRNDSLITGARVNEERLRNLSDLNYTLLKDQFGVSADFCIHFEDQSGNVVNVSGNRTGLGSSRALIAGVTCGN